MTYEEAIKVLRFVLDPREYPNGEKSKCYQYNLGAINKAIEALEKQIAKKPKWIYGKDMGIAKCSVCGKELHYYMKGCPECLNVIDWSDDDGI